MKGILAQESTSARAHMQGSARSAQGVVQGWGRELVGEYLARLAGGWLDPEHLGEVRRVLTSWL